MPSIREILLVPHTHHDIGYTNTPRACLEGHERGIYDVLDLCERDPDDAPDAFRWTVEISRPLAQFLSLGYLLESSARVARTGRLRDGLIGVRRAARLGGLVAGVCGALVPAWLVGSFARAAELGNDCVYLYERDDLFGPLHDDPRWAAFLAGARKRSESYREELRWPVEGSGVGR